MIAPHTAVIVAGCHFVVEAGRKSKQGPCLLAETCILFHWFAQELVVAVVYALVKTR